jgi:anti-sigma B factor antagonist
MTLSIDERAGAVVVVLDGDVMGGPDGTALHERLAELKQAGRRHVVIDLGGVRFMNSSGLGMLIGALTTMRNAGGDLRLARVGERVENLLTMTKLAAVFKQFPTVETAVSSFADA